jgi:zinc D-Ala-D-Ala carboxypeptidase
MRMKHIMLISVSTLLMTGCSQMYSLIDKVPFLSKDNQDQITNEPVSPDEVVDPLSLEAIFFNEVKQVDGKNVIQNSTNTMALVNKEFFLPEDYVPEDLVRPEVPFSFGDVENDKSLMRKEAASALEKMFADAENAGIELFAVSGYRSYERQKILFDAETSRVGREQAMQVIAIPGSSEHQSGLAMDISSRSIALNLVEGFADTEEGKWLAENAHRFGFILRYPKGKEQITNYIFEPWHFRYVGEKAAQIIHEHNWTLEEYFNEVKKI